MGNHGIAIAIPPPMRVLRLASDLRYSRDRWTVSLCLGYDSVANAAHLHLLLQPCDSQKSD
ncbi:hypothetical protein [Coleofasciculus sp. FACHB-1120]|uniref:hypothetical protein n=1 Tax=Coleofasciculus sp. FACHB-1120 TaxID=2692783 RepID=UPI001685EA10|nr:hypothetical protein [Coleofasciculus sp. FACHB-1120]MBD2743968.1 hypothetical protein [Coleofasciculus sp. FACHB-1120]